MAKAVLAFIVLLFLGALWIGLMLVVFPKMAYAHHAKTGWEYPYACCSGMDCDHITPSAVKLITGGFRVTLKAGEHPMVKEPMSFDIPYTQAKVSKDEDYHICISATGRMLCFYAPPFSY